MPVPGGLRVQAHVRAALAGLRCHTRLRCPTAFGRPPVQHPAPLGKLDTFVGYLCKLSLPWFQASCQASPSRGLVACHAESAARSANFSVYAFWHLDQHGPRPIRQLIPMIATSTSPANRPCNWPLHCLDIVAQSVPTLPHPGTSFGLANNSVIAATVGSGTPD